MRKLKYNKKLVAIAAILAFVSSFLTVYTVNAQIVATLSVYQDSLGILWWRTTPKGSLFPWPRESGILQKLSEFGEADSFIYTYLIRSWILAGTTIVMWICTAIYIFRAARSNLPKTQPSEWTQ